MAEGEYQLHTLGGSCFFEGLRASTCLFIGTDINGTSPGIDDYNPFPSLVVYSVSMGRAQV